MSLKPKTNVDAELFPSIHHGNTNKCYPWEDSAKGKETLWGRKDSCGWKMPYLTSSLPVDSDSIGIRTSSETCLQKSAQKIKRTVFSVWLACLLLTLSLGGNPLQWRLSVALEGFTFLFLSIWSKVLLTCLDRQLYLGHRVDAKRIRKYSGNWEVMSLESEDYRHCQCQ